MRRLSQFHSPTFFPAAVFVLLSLSACKDDPKPVPHTAPSATPIASDMVFNSFFASPSATANLKVAFDGGADNALGGGGGDNGGGAHVVDQGAEPRAKLQYAFAIGKPAVVTSTLTMSVKANGPGGGGDQPPFKFTFLVTPKSKADGKTHFEIKVQKVEIIIQGAAPPPEIAQQKAAMEKAFVGLDGSFDATPDGQLENITFSSEKVPRGAQDLLPMLGQSLEFLVVALPSAPVGIGGKWTTSSSASDGQFDGTVLSTYTLVSKDGTNAEIKAETSRSAPKKVVEDPRAPEGTTVELKGSGTYTIDIRTDGVSKKVDGSSTMNVLVVSPDKQSQSTTVKQSQSLESK